MKKTGSVSVVIPTYRREEILVETITHLQRLDPAPAEILVVDQTPAHGPGVTERLRHLDETHQIRWRKLPSPSITRAMNVGLLEARHEFVLFVDDDVAPHPRLLSAHLEALQDPAVTVVAGRVIQPWQIGREPADNTNFSFFSDKKQWANEFIGCNFSLSRQTALDLGGFDENFVHVAYRFEAEFANRVLTAGGRILFEPAACLNHLKAGSGGTRSFGEHMTTIRPSHAVGEYYYLLRASRIKRRALQILWRPFRAIRTRHHLRHPWWIPGTLLAEFLGLGWALYLWARGPRYIGSS